MWMWVHALALCVVRCPPCGSVQVRSGQEVENAEIVRFARLFNDELTLDNLERLQVGSGWNGGLLVCQCWPLPFLC